METLETDAVLVKHLDQLIVPSLQLSLELNLCLSSLVFFLFIQTSYLHGELLCSSITNLKTP